MRYIEKLIPLSFVILLVTCGQENPDTIPFIDDSAADVSDGNLTVDPLALDSFYYLGALPLHCRDRGSLNLKLFEEIEESSNLSGKTFILDLFNTNIANLPGNPEEILDRWEFDQVFNFREYEEIFIRVYYSSEAARLPEISSNCTETQPCEMASVSFPESTLLISSRINSHSFSISEIVPSDEFLRLVFTVEPNNEDLPYLIEECGEGCDDGFVDPITCDTGLIDSYILDEEPRVFPNH